MTRTTPVADTVTIHVPFRLVKRGGRREMQLPADTSRQHKPDSTLIKALARAFRWKRMLDTGEVATIADLAEREGIAPSYPATILQLTRLAPDIVEAILNGRKDGQETASLLKGNLADDWAEQRQMLYGSA